MNDDNPILYGSDGWYDAITGERINPAGRGKNPIDLALYETYRRMVLEAFKIPAVYAPNGDELPTSTENSSPSATLTLETFVEARKLLAEVNMQSKVEITFIGREHEISRFKEHLNGLDIPVYLYRTFDQASVKKSDFAPAGWVYILVNEAPDEVLLSKQRIKVFKIKID